MMEYSLKDRFILAIYAEYQKDLPIFDGNFFDELGINVDNKAFLATIKKLLNEYLINSEGVCLGADGYITINTDSFSPTVRGIDYAEGLLSVVEKDSSPARMGKALEKLKQLGEGIMVSYIASKL